MDFFLTDSTELMLLGMGTVFIFLSLLVVSVMLMSTIINKLNLTEPAPKCPPATSETVIAAVAVSAWTKKQTN